MAESRKGGGEGEGLAVGRWTAAGKGETKKEEEE